VVLEGLSENLRDTLSKVASANRVDEELVEEIVRDIQRALLQADVEVKLALELTRSIKERALEEEPTPGVNPREHVIQIVHDELVDVLGASREIELKPQTIMLVGLYGQGKTTTAGKLAKYFQQRGLKVGLVAADVHRPAAYNQLKQISEQVDAPFYGEEDADDDEAADVVERGLDEIRDETDIQIVDTSGRHSLEDELIQEMEDVFEVADPDEKILVIDATVGQQAGPQAQAFDDAVDISGVILTKLDGSAKGGGALSAVSETGAPIVFVGTGEHLDDIESFEPSRFISRILGMGDIQTLLEKAQHAVEDEEKAEQTAEAILEGDFTLHELRDQMEMLNNMGSMQKIMDMIPGIGGMKDKMPQGHLEQSEEQMGKFMTMMDSMTDEEMSNPNDIKASRMRRVAEGSGYTKEEVKELLDYFRMSQRAIEGLSSDRGMQKRLMQQLDMGDLPDELT